MLSDFKNYICNRWIHKSHVLSSPKLKKGRYYEFDTRLLNCMMDSFVDYLVNEECPHTIMCYKLDVKGLSERELVRKVIQLRINDCMNDEHGPWEDHVKVYDEMWEIYTWWVDYKDFSEYDTEWNIFNREMKDKYGDFLPNLNEEESSRSHELMEIHMEQEKAHRDKTNEMLCRLIKIRESLWT